MKLQFGESQLVALPLSTDRQIVLKDVGIVRGGEANDACGFMRLARVRLGSRSMKKRAGIIAQAFRIGRSFKSFFGLMRAL